MPLRVTRNKDLLKGIVVGDCHFCDYVPIKRTDDFLEAQFEKLRKIREIAVEREADFTFLLGDVFDKARPNMWLVNRLISNLMYWPCPVVTVVGNHDIQGCRDGIPGTALGTLLEAEVITKLEGDRDFNGVPMRGITHTREHSADLYKSDKPIITFTHNMITPWEVPYEHIHTDEILKTANGVVFAGDYHGAYDKQNQRARVINPGVLVRTDISEKDIKPSVLYFEVTPSEFVRKIEKIPLGASAGEDVFDIARHEKEKSEELNLKEFIDSIKTTQFQSQDIEKLIYESGKESKVSKEVIEEAVQRIKTAKAVS